jgi:hypothetical protein
LKENNKQHIPATWGHKILRIVKDDTLNTNTLTVRPKEKINHILIDDLQYEYESLSLEGWRYQMGFSLDDDSFYLYYKKPIDKLK